MALYDKLDLDQMMDRYADILRSKGWSKSPVSISGGPADKYFDWEFSNDDIDMQIICEDPYEDPTLCIYGDDEEFFIQTIRPLSITNILKIADAAIKYFAENPTIDSFGSEFARRYHMQYGI